MKRSKKTFQVKFWVSSHLLFRLLHFCHSSSVSVQSDVLCRSLLRAGGQKSDLLIFWALDFEMYTWPFRHFGTYDYYKKVKPGVIFLSTKISQLEYFFFKFSFERILFSLLLLTYPDTQIKNYNSTRLPCRLVIWLLVPKVEHRLRVPGNKIPNNVFGSKVKEEIGWR